MQLKKQPAAHHHDGRVDLGGLEVVIIEQVEIGDGDAVKVGKQRTHGVFDKAAVLVLEPERLDGGVILSGAHFVAELQLGVFPVADADAVDLGHGKHFAGHEGAVIAAADDEHVRPDLARPADIKLRVGEGGGADGKADDVKLPLFAQLFLELGFLVQIQQMQQLHLMPALLEYGGNGGQPLAVIAARDLALHVAVGIIGVDQQHPRLTSVQIYHIPSPVSSGRTSFLIQIQPFASYHVRPICVSATSGTRRENARSIHVCSSDAACSASDSGDSTISSS